MLRISAALLNQSASWSAHANQAMIEEFVPIILENHPPSVTWQDGYEALRVALACYEWVQAKVVSEKVDKKPQEW
jgi:predicted dehydrogenase